jgi:hypothetical protein
MGFIPVVPISDPLADHLGIPEQYCERGILLSDEGEGGEVTVGELVFKLQVDFLFNSVLLITHSSRLQDDGEAHPSLTLSDEGEGGEVTVGEPAFSNAAEEQTGPDQQQVYLLFNSIFLITHSPGL